MEFTGDAWLKDARTEVASETLVYSTVTQRVISDEPVVITIQPGERTPRKAEARDHERARRRRSLEKSYRKRKVVSSLSLSIASGEVVGLLGPNGAGKTTAFYMIVGLVPVRRRAHHARRRGHHAAADARARAARRRLPAAGAVDLPQADRSSTT